MADFSILCQFYTQYRVDKFFHVFIQSKYQNAFRFMNCVPCTNGEKYYDFNICNFLKLLLYSVHLFEVMCPYLPYLVPGRFLKSNTKKKNHITFDKMCLLQAISKIREFLMQKIYSFRKPMSNYQVPQNAMLKFRFVWIYTCMCNIHKLIQQLNYCTVIHASQCMYTLKNKIIMNGLRQYNYTVSVKSFEPCSFILMICH